MHLLQCIHWVSYTSCFSSDAVLALCFEAQWLHRQTGATEIRHDTYAISLTICKLSSQTHKERAEAEVLQRLKGPFFLLVQMSTLLQPLHFWFACDDANGPPSKLHSPFSLGPDLTTEGSVEFQRGRSCSLAHPLYDQASAEDPSP